MPFKRTPMRYAHKNGYTSCTYSEKGDFIITCGSDGDIRTWEGIDDDDVTSKCLGEFIICLDQYGEKLLVSTELNTVQAFTYPNIERDGTELRFTAPITCIKHNKEFVGAGSEDTFIKVFRKDKSETEFQLVGHQGPILALDLSSKNMLASISGDGSLKVWDLIEKTEIKTINGLPNYKSFENVQYFGTPSFDPLTGNLLAYANKREIIVLDTSNWEVKFKLTDDKITGEYSCCQFSVDGKLIAAGTRKGEFSVWNFSEKSTISGQTADSETQCITTIVWNPKNNGELAYCESTGRLGTLVDLTLNDYSDQNDFLNNEASENADELGFEGIIFKDDDDDDDDGNGVSLEKLKNDTMRANGVPIDENSRDSLTSLQSVSTANVPVSKIYLRQSAFQPSSTPNDLEHRYLVWNNVGIVRAHVGENDGSIDVEFHDVSVHHNLHINNYLNHTMASLSSTVLALSGENSSKLVCITLTASGSKEWSVEMPDCEGVAALVATTKVVAVVTDNWFLRIFSVMGTQREVIALPGPVITMCGHADKLMICYHSAPASADQHVSALLIQIFGLTLRTRDIRIPLPAGKRLKWVGYSDCGSPAFCDTMGLVQMFSMKTNCWYPICDTMKHAQSVSNNFFVVDISERNQIIQAVLCRGSTYPMTNPRPMATEIPMQMPICDNESEKSELEETLIRSSNFAVENAEKVVKETALKLFALACRSEMEARAKELIEMIASPALLPLAVKYASKLGRIHLADKLSELLPEIEQKEDEREKEMRENDSDALTLIQNSSLNAGLLLMQRNTPKTETPKIVPKPMTLSNQKRNPFKRSGNTPTTSKENPFSHLMEKVIGFSSQTSNSIDDTPSSIIEDSQPKFSNENQSNNEQTEKRETFVSWFSKNESNLQTENSDATLGELTKIGMKKYKLLLSEKKEESGSVKRKLDIDHKDGSNTFSSKLAKFDFKHQA